MDCTEKQDLKSEHWEVTRLSDTGIGHNVLNRYHVDTGIYTGRRYTCRRAELYVQIVYNLGRYSAPQLQECALQDAAPCPGSAFCRSSL